MAKKTPSDVKDTAESAEVPANTVTGTGPAPEKPKKPRKKAAPRKRKAAAGPDVGPDGLDLYDRVEAWLATGGAANRAAFLNAAVILLVFALILVAHWATQVEVVEHAVVEPVARAVETESHDHDGHDGHDHSHADASTDESSNDSTSVAANETAEASSTDTAAAESTDSATNTTTTIATSSSASDAAATTESLSDKTETSSTIVANTASSRTPKSASSDFVLPVELSAGKSSPSNVSLLALLNPAAEIPEAPTVQATAPVRTARATRRSRIPQARGITRSTKYNAGGNEDLDNERYRQHYQELNFAARNQ